jgi:hypothetical protein
MKRQEDVGIEYYLLCVVIGIVFYTGMTVSSLDRDNKKILKQQRKIIEMQSQMYSHLFKGK